MKINNNGKNMGKRVRAIIAEEDKVLFIHRVTHGKEYWVLPGGGVEKYDADLESALIRECEEELGVDVEVGDFYMNTYFEMNGEEQEQHIFFCKVVSGELGTGQGPEYQPDSGYEGTYEIEWVSLLDLEDKNILPEEIKYKFIGEQNESD